MGLFKNKKEAAGGEPQLPQLPELPELPPITRLPELPQSRKFEERKKISSIKSLPSFSGDFGTDFSQEIIKTAASPDTEKRTIEIGDSRAEGLPDNFPGQDFSPITEPEISLPRAPRTNQYQNYPAVQQQRKTEPIYIRLDKFKSAVQNFEEIRNRITEIEELLKQIRELKFKEDQELREWERELEAIKARIDYIDGNIFSKLD